MVIQPELSTTRILERYLAKEQTLSEVQALLFVNGVYSSASDPDLTDTSTLSTAEKEWRHKYSELIPLDWVKPIGREPEVLIPQVINTLQILQGKVPDYLIDAALEHPSSVVTLQVALSCKLSYRQILIALILLPKKKEVFLEIKTSQVRYGHRTSEIEKARVEALRIRKYVKS